MEKTIGKNYGITYHLLEVHYFYHLLRMHLRRIFLEKHSLNILIVYTTHTILL